MSQRPRNKKTFEPVDFEDFFKLHTQQVAILESVGLGITDENLGLFEQIDIETAREFVEFDQKKLRDKLINELVKQGGPIVPVEANDKEEWDKLVNFFNSLKIPF
ncbi:hypothetical protein [Putridiphycobacter roseus]|uniref:hypothetical protein n=1 Tax=Putridiphycobacter roseus TaxID=2219161 RepID=UPI0011B7CFD0|nr:hypothetical protein [Putridiphycobacter roseus]